MGLSGLLDQFAIHYPIAFVILGLLAAAGIGLSIARVAEFINNYYNSHWRPPRKFTLMPKQLREVETKLGLTHLDLGLALGISEECVARMATGKDAVSEQTAKQIVSLLIIEREGLRTNYDQAIAKCWCGDTMDF